MEKDQFGCATNWRQIDMDKVIVGKINSSSLSEVILTKKSEVLEYGTQETGKIPAYVNLWMHCGPFLLSSP